MEDLGRMSLSDAMDAGAYRPPTSDEIKRRLIEKAELLAELNAKVQSEPTQGAPLKPAIETQEWGQPTGRITADGRKLAGLMSRAKKLEAAARVLHERANAAGQAAYTARLELNNYMTSNGLA